METIYKYPLRIADRQVLEVPVGARFLHAAFQGSTLCAWFRVNTERGLRASVIHIYGTGHPIENADNLTHLATVQQPGDALVWHIFADHSYGA